MHAARQHNPPGGKQPPDDTAPYEVMRQLKMAQDISTRIRLLLHDDVPNDAAATALENLRRITGMDKLAIFEKQPGPEDGVKCAWRYQTGGDHATADEWKTYRPDREMRDRLTAGQAVRVNFSTHGAAGDLDGDRKDTKPCLVFPIRVFGEWWGGLCLDEGLTDVGEDFPLFEAFATVADLFGIFFERQIESRENAESDKLAGALEMAGTVCHKLNQPMQVILGYASMVTSGDISEPEQVREIVKMIEDETRRMGIITKNLMGITQYRSVETPEVVSICDIDSHTAIS